MIKSIELKNFRSHKDSKLVFSNGINTIIGSSGRGKTQVLRAFYWVKDNKPDGLSYISHFNRDAKGNPIEPTEVILELENNVFIIRSRSKEFDGYKIIKNEKEKTFEAMNRKVPEEVTTLLNLTEVNVQKQMDAPFLLSGSAGEAARFLNGIIRLDIIDNVLGKADMKHRKLVKDKELNEREIENASLNIKKLMWVDDAKQICTLAETVEKEIKINNNSFNTITFLQSELTHEIQKIEDINYITEATFYIQQLELCAKEINENIQNQDRIINLQEILTHIENEKISFDISTANTLIQSIETCSTDILNLENNIWTLRVLEKDYNYNTKIENEQINKIKEYRERYKKLLPNVCPICKKPITDKDTCI